MKLKSVPAALTALPSALASTSGEQRHTPNRGKLYGRRYQIEREQYLAEHRYCVMCLARGIREPATIYDHIVPHKGNESLFWDKANRQPLCKPDHDRTKQAIEAAANGDIDKLLELNNIATIAPGVPLGWEGGSNPYRT